MHNQCVMIILFAFEITLCWLDIYSDDKKYIAMGREGCYAAIIINFCLKGLYDLRQ